MQGRVQMGMQMIDPSSAMRVFEKQANKMDRLKKTTPAVVCGIAPINPWVDRDIKQRTEISAEIPPGYVSMLLYHTPGGSRLNGIHILHRGPNLVYLHLNNLFVGVDHGKDLNRYTDFSAQGSRSV